MADVNRVSQVQMLRHRSQIGGIVVHVVAVADLSRPPVAAPVMRDDAEAFTEEKQHLRIPIVRREGPAMAEHDRLTDSPILIEDLNSVLRRDVWHSGTPKLAIA
jgi:hypothetical protein